jgi:hypothetical protein
MSAQITPELEKIFKLEAGTNPRLMEKLREKALNHHIQAPVLSYDESVIQVGATGSFAPTVSELTATSPKILNLKLRCMVKQDAYINVVFPMPGGQSISIILTRHCKEALAPLHEMSKSYQEELRRKAGGYVVPQGRVGTNHTPPLNPTPTNPNRQTTNPPRAQEGDRTKHHYFFTFLICLGLFYYLFKFDAVS